MNPYAARSQALLSIIKYITEEAFSLKHIKAIQTVVHLFNRSEESEQEIFSFVGRLEEKYGRL